MELSEINTLQLKNRFPERWEVSRFSLIFQPQIANFTQLCLLYDTTAQISVQLYHITNKVKLEIRQPTYCSVPSSQSLDTSIILGHQGFNVYHLYIYNSIHWVINIFDWAL